ncbi:hypothetical protein [Moraxella catarrhalis]|uniref:hypothetical protein n=1 Tax=Moraxella catarrhalis TaxID=480 RepID=UPI0013D0FCF9|nr:hypothetical protein [Moraxella catarrhalis]
MKYYACVGFSKIIKDRCILWQEIDLNHSSSANNLFSDFANLSFEQANVLLSWTAIIFATAWVWRLLSKQAFR